MTELLDVIIIAQSAIVSGGIIAVVVLQFKSREWRKECQEKKNDFENRLPWS